MKDKHGKKVVGNSLFRYEYPGMLSKIGRLIKPGLVIQWEDDNSLEDVERYEGIVMASRITSLH